MLSRNVADQPGYQWLAALLQGKQLFQREQPYKNDRNDRCS